MYLSPVLTARGTIITNSALIRLLQLSSVSLPVGGYAFSQGLEYAVESGWVDDGETARQWLQAQIEYALAEVDLPVLRHAYAVEPGEFEPLVMLNAIALACRETAELRLTDVAMGEALLRLLRGIEPSLVEQIVSCVGEGEDYSFVVMFALTARHWQIDEETAAVGLAWSWLENQVAAATKLIPLGQTQAQQLLTGLQSALEVSIRTSKDVSLENVGASLPALAIASALHETQYTRLFRS